MVKANDLLGHGYLPKQLPPTFFSEKWAAAVKGHGIKPVTKHPESVLLRLSVPRPRGLPRVLGIPHPAHFHRLAQLIEGHWTDLIAICNRSQLSISTPRIGDRSKGERALEATGGFAAFPSLALERRAGKRFVLKADVSQCYPSIYTHALSWAIQGKASAKAAYKAKDTGSHPGDLIDKAVRDGQERQSAGIPIGPDTSFVLANVLLSRVDEILQSEIKGLVGLRQLDDFQLYFDSVAEAESARTILAQALAEYSLTLNPGKTKVVALPESIEPDWKHRLSELYLDGNVNRARKRLRSAADYAFEQRQSDDGSRALTYLLSVLAGCNYSADLWPLAQAVALASCEFEENSLPRAAKLFIAAKGRGWTIDTDRLAGLLNRSILRHAQLRHGQSIAWAIWLMIVLDLDVSPEAVNAVDSTRDPIALTVLAHGRESGCVKGFKINDSAKALATANCWNEPQWFFLYECLQHGWLGPSTGPSLLPSLKTQPYLSSLNKRKVSFYDVSSGAITKLGKATKIVLKHPDAHAFGKIELTPEYE